MGSVGTEDVASVPRERLADILRRIAADDSWERVSIADLLRLMGPRARAALIFLFAFPNMLPAPPGLSAVLGLPLLYLTAQTMLGRVPWLPRVVASRDMPRAAFAALAERILPLLERAERMLRPRWSPLTKGRAERAVGAFALALAVVVTLPIPLGNMLPAFAICLLALGLLERDGLWVLIGVAVGTLALAVSGTVVYAMVRAFLFVILEALP